MNIFCTDNDPIIAAKELCDQHVRSKMQIEGAIMLAHAFPQEVLNHEDCPRTSTGKPRSPRQRQPVYGLCRELLCHIALQISLGAKATTASLWLMC